MSNWIRFWLNPLSEFLGNWWLGDVLCPRSSNWGLRNILGPWLGNWWLRNIFNVSLLNGWWLDVLDMLDWISWRNNCLNGLVSVVSDIIPSGVKDGIVIEGVGIIEVLVGDSRILSIASPRSLLKISWLISDNDEIIVRVVVHEVGVVKVEVSESSSDLGESGLLNDDGEIIPWVGIVEVLIRYSGHGVSDGCVHFKVSAWAVVGKDWVVIHGFVVKEIGIRDLKC